MTTLVRTTGRRRGWVCVALLVALACTRAAPAAAQDIAGAEALFTRGVEALRAGRYEQACAALAESQRLDPQAGTLFTLAQCEAKLGRTATAIARYRDYLALFAGMTADQRSAHKKREAIAREQLAVLGPQVPELTLTLPEKAPRGTIVKKDGVLVSAGTLGIALPVDPGPHVVSAQAPGGPWTETRFSLGSGERRSIVVEVKPAPAPPPPARPSAPEGTSGLRVAAYVAGALGFVGLSVGGAMGGLTLAKKAIIDENCGVDGIKTRCRNQAGADAGNSAQTTALASTIGVAVGGASLATAIVLWLAEPRRAKPPARGATVRPGMLAADGTGLVLGLRGTW